MPWPRTVSVQPGSLAITGSLSVSVSGAGETDARVQDEVARMFGRLTKQTGIPILPRVVKDDSATLAIVIRSSDHHAPQQLGDNERYSLQVSGSQARLSADAPLGAIRGIETFLQLVQQTTKQGESGTATPGFSLADVTIEDEPRFPWRGLSLDVSRHFIPIENIRRTLDGMSAVKLNVLHWHLSDDQGFRVESKKFPRLQQYGSNGFFYTQAEIADTIAYARNRGIRIVPEFDMPGHATSWLPGYPELGAGNGEYQITKGYGILSDLIDPSQESTYRFLDGFIGEMSKLFPDEYFHIGGDEVDPKQWNGNPRIQEFMKKHGMATPLALHVYFNQRLLKIVTKYGKHMEGWDEVLQPNLPKTILIQSWRGQQSLWQAAKAGYGGILSAGYYLDLIYPASYHYSIDPMKVPEKAPNHDEQEEPEAQKGPAPGTPTDLTAEQKKLILGGEGAMWVELATPENLDAKLWPRLAAIAERLWSPESVTDTDSMYRRLEITNHWLESLGLTQRTSLVLMKQRLAGTMPVQPLITFASILEPVRGYARNSELYTISSPLNRLVDTVPPESDAAREFREGVDRYLSGSKDAQGGELLRKQLAIWSENVAAVRPMLEGNSLLNEDLPLADAAAVLCKVGQEALSYLGGSASPSAGWKGQSLTAVEGAYKRPGGHEDSDRTCNSKAGGSSSQPLNVFTSS